MLGEIKYTVEEAKDESGNSVAIDLFKQKKKQNFGGEILFFTLRK